MKILSNRRKLALFTSQLVLRNETLSIDTMQIDYGEAIDKIKNFKFKFKFWSEINSMEEFIQNEILTIITSPHMNSH